MTVSIHAIPIPKAPKSPENPDRRYRGQGKRCKSHTGSEGGVEHGNEELIHGASEGSLFISIFGIKIMKYAEDMNGIYDSYWHQKYRYHRAHNMYFISHTYEKSHCHQYTHDRDDHRRKYQAWFF